MTQLKKLAAHSRNCVNAANTRRNRNAAALAAVTLMVAGPALAGTDTTFSTMTTTLTGWITGSLGVLIGTAGVVYGVLQLFRQNYGAAFVSVAAGLGGSAGPAVIASMFTFVI